jgi:hypothetical protein
MSDDVEWTPGVGTFVRHDPVVRKIPQKRIEYGRGSRQEGHCLLHDERTSFRR